MKRQTLLAAIWLAVSVLCFFVGAAAGAEEGGPAPLALTGLDPTELVEGREVQGKADLVATHGKFRYAFASEANMNRFKAQPDTYVIQRDGYCVVYPDAEVHPDLFTVYEGHIYGFASNECIEKFEKDPEHYLDPEFQIEYWRATAERYIAERNECRKSLTAQKEDSPD